MKQICCDLLNFPTFARYQASLDQLALSTVPTVPSPTQTTRQAWPGLIKTPWEHTGSLGEPLQMRRDSWPTMPSLARSRACRPWLLFVSSSTMLICARYLRTALFKHPRDHITKVPSTRHNPATRKSCHVTLSVAARKICLQLGKFKTIQDVSREA